MTDYEASAGVQGGTVDGAPVVILTSVGAKSGKVRKNPVVRIVDGDRYVARLQDGLLAEHRDVPQDEATAEQSKSGLPMFGDTLGRGLTWCRPR